jgi:hypothetical protein
MEIIALVFSGLAIVVAVAGTVLSNLRSTEALELSKRAEASAVWSPVQRLIGFDPSREPVGERLANLRIAGIALADDLGWESLDSWLKAERALGSAYAQQAMLDSSPNDTPDRRLDVTQPYWTSADVLGHNLRRFRKEGYKADEMNSLRSHALGEVNRIHEKHGCPLPSTTLPGVQALGD